MNKKGLTPLIVTIIVALIIGAGVVGYQTARVKERKVVTSTPTTRITANTKNTAPSSIIPHSILVYLTAKRYNGNLGGRKGADLKCTPPAGVPCIPGTQHALLSVNSQDQAKDMPKNFNFSPTLPVFWYNQDSHKFIPLVDKWTNLFNIVNSLENPSILNTQKDALKKEYFVWTGTRANGTVPNDYTCKEWTTSYVENPGAGTGPFAIFGGYNNMFWEADGWAGFSLAQQCNNHYHLRCMCLSEHQE